ncbi:MAG: hypothetical protein J0H31_26490 [Alphaproteobacteria bacterium]|nr:hypothetical protein [Alphaproteobacteria bacterium]
MAPQRFALVLAAALDPLGIEGKGYMSNYHNLTYGPTDLQTVMHERYAKLIAFVTTSQFRTVIDELFALHPNSRPAYVQRVLLDPLELEKRGIVVPEGILIQRSAFGDRRPTLFAVKHFLPDGFRDVWENVNLTFDNEYAETDVSRERDDCWRSPLSPTEQALQISSANDRSLNHAV